MELLFTHVAQIYVLGSFGRYGENPYLNADVFHRRQFAEAHLKVFSIYGTGLYL